MIDDDEICPHCDGAIGMMVPAELRCHCVPTEPGDHPYRAAAPTPLPATPLNLVELFDLHGDGAKLHPMGPLPDSVDL